MTKQVDVVGNAKYIPVLDHGFVGLIDTMGNDAAIVQAARVSYGSGTKTVNEDRALVRYLMRHLHSTPFEMCDTKWHLKMPIFVARQLIRHRTASTNEISYRYSVMDEEVYRPDVSDIQPQSSDNKQGRAGDLSDKNKEGVLWIMDASYEHSGKAYKSLLGEDVDNFYDLKDTVIADSIIENDFPGIARELARVVTPVGSYTEMYWKIDLKNLFHFLKLRSDAHAQKEIRVYAEAMIDLARKHFPIAFEAWEDYSRYSSNTSRMEIDLIKHLFSDPYLLGYFMQDYVTAKGNKNMKNFADTWSMSVREMNDFVSKYVGAI